MKHIKLELTDKEVRIITHALGDAYEVQCERYMEAIHKDDKVMLVDALDLLGANYAVHKKIEAQLASQ